MSSAIPYHVDEDDMIDNNPFAEAFVERESGEEQQVEQENQATKPQDQQEQGPDGDQTEIQKQEQESKVNDDKYLEIIPERKPSKYTLMIKVKGLERVGSTANKKESPTILLDAQTNLPTFRKQHYKNLRKTPDEFQQLFKYLNGAIQESFIPSVPRAYTNYGINSNEDYEKTIRNFQKWFDRICNDPLILRNEELAFFIESDFNTYSPINKAKLPATGLKRKTLKQLAPPYDETIELAEFRPLVKSIHWICQDVQTKLFKESKAKKILAQEENAFGQGFLALNDRSQNHLYKKFGKILNAVGDMDSIIASLDVATLNDSLDWIVKDTYVVKEALTNRHLIMRELTQAQQNLKARQDQARKLRAKKDINPLKVDEALRLLKNATEDEQLLTHKLQRITMNMLIERNTWLEWYESCVARSIKEYTLRKIEYERKKLTLLERIRIDVRRADSNGGLSRLGREGKVPDHNTKHSEFTSQTTKGDDWTGEPRYRSPSQLAKLARTELDDVLDVEGEAFNKNKPNSQQDDTNDLDSSSLDARNAASMLGLPTF